LNETCNIKKIIGFEIIRILRNLYIPKWTQKNHRKSRKVAPGSDTGNQGGKKVYLDLQKRTVGRGILADQNAKRGKKGITRNEENL